MDELGLGHVQRLEAALFEANYGVKYYSDKLSDLSTQVEQMALFAAEPSLNELAMYLGKNLIDSNGQLLQDLIIRFIFNDKKGFFCEFGAADGTTLSNTFLLEKLGWDGILAEPSVRWRGLLSQNRKCKISYECVYPTSGEQLMFNEVDEGMFSSLVEFSSSDMHANRRTNGLEYLVESISLGDLLRKFSAPQYVDFLSVDTEGSELAILEAFDFSSFTFGAIFVEHNFTENREKIHHLLTANGYFRVFSRFSRWDDWYLDKNKYNFLRSKIGDGELL
jgi:FkbM family methyltransferase